MDDASAAAGDQERPERALSSGGENYGCSRRFGRPTAAGDDNFAAPVRSWDVHVYFDSTSTESTLFALELRYQTMQVFPDLTVNRPYRSPVGPHTQAMWSCELHTPEQFSRYIPWFCTRRGELSALLHPVTGNDLLDHTERCFWIGDKLPLRLQIFAA